MVWSGRTRVYGRTGGRYGFEVRLGDAMVPRHAFFDLEGENGEPDLRVHFEVRDGVPTVVDFHVSAKGSGRGIRSSDLGMFNLDNFTTNVFQHLATVVVGEGEHAVTASPPTDERQAWRARAGVDDAVKTRGRGVTRAELERVAAVYREHLHGSPNLAVKNELGYGSERTAARRVKQAEDAGLLPKTTRGKRRG